VKLQTEQKSFGSFLQKRTRLFFFLKKKEAKKTFI